MTSWELRDCIFNHKHKAGSLQQSPKPDPRDVLLLAKLHLLKVLQPPQIVPPVGEHTFKHVSLWEDFLIQSSTTHKVPDAGAHICIPAVLHGGGR